MKVNDSAAKEFIMLEKLSPSLLNQLYGFLTNGNEDICLSTTRLRAENPEKATGSPIAFGMALLKMNLLLLLIFSIFQAGIMNLLFIRTKMIL